MCKEVGAKFMAGRALALVPRCNENNIETKIKSDQTKFFEEHFEFVCNFTKAEYKGFFISSAKKSEFINFKPCFDMIERTFPSNRTLPDFCG